MKKSFNLENGESFDMSVKLNELSSYANSKLSHTLTAALIACSSMITSCLAKTEITEDNQTPIPEEKEEVSKLGFGAVSFNADFVAFQGGYQMSPIIIQAYLDGVLVSESDVIPPGRFKFEVPYTAKNKRVDFKAFLATKNGDLGQEIEYTRDHKTTNPYAMVVISTGMNFGW